MQYRNRNIHIDNIKAVLIFLVVFGHLIEMNIAGNDALKGIWIFIYSFHMPMFALVSGMFSKASLSENQTSQLVKNIAIPLLAFEILYECLELIIHGKPSNYFFNIAPYWMLWYLLSLLCWRLMLPIFSKIQYAIPVAIAVSLLTSYSDNAGYFLSISRTLTFFPFFLLGWKLSDGFLSVANKKTMAVNILVLVAAIPASFLALGWDYRWLYGSYSLASLNMANTTGFLYQMALYGLSALIGLSFLNIITRREVGISHIGKNSIYVYLWHGFAIIGLSQTIALETIFKLPSIVATPILVLISIAIIWLGSHRRCVDFTDRFILNPLASLLMIKQQVATELPVIPRA